MNHIYFSNRYHVLDVLLYIFDKINNKKPMSLIRLGDAEGRFLGYPEFVEKEGEGNDVLDFALKLELGRVDFSEDDLKSLSLQMRKSVKNADVIGLPREKQYKENIAYQYVFDAIEQFDLLNNKQKICDAAIHRYLQFGLFYQDILRKRDFIGVITGRPDFAEVVKNEFQIKEVKSYLVPAEAIHPDNIKGEHFPDCFYTLKRDLEVPYQGAIFLVGAGYLGKIYCQWIKENGGIAIDVGSICDSWTGKGRLQHDLHGIRHYKKGEHLSLAKRAEKFNHACNHFAIDSHRLNPQDIKEYISKL